MTDRGQGEPLLLVTGWTISSAVFDPVADRYLPHVRVIAYDHRGAGRSSPWLAPVSMAMLAADAARVLDDRGVRSAHVVGLSMGAAVALELAVRMPWRVKSLVLVGGGAGGPSTVTPSLRRAAGAVGAVAGDSMRHRAPWPAAALFSRRFREEHPDKVADYMPYFAVHRAPPWMTGFQTLAVACFGRSGSLARVRAPTLVLHGGRDVMAPPENARLLAEGIPGAELAMFEDAGHAVPLEQPEPTTELMLDWISRHVGSEPLPASSAAIVGERLSRPFSLPAGSIRNTLDATRLVASRIRMKTSA